MKRIDVARLCLPDEVKSNRLRVHRVKSEDNLADTGTEALSKRKPERMRYPWVCCSRELEIRRCHWVDESEQEDQSRSAHQKT